MGFGECRRGGEDALGETMLTLMEGGGIGHQ